jgi:predicted nucleotidyltransferase
MKSGNKMHYKDELVALVCKHMPSGKIYLFGSRARGTHGPMSDVDIAIDAGKPIDPLLMSLIKEDIEESTVPFFVDVLDFQRLDADMQKTILDEGIVWKT